MFRGQKRDRFQKTGFERDDSGAIVGLIVDQQLRLIHVDAAAGRRGPHATFDVGRVIGSMHARIAFNLSNPGAPGTNEAPIPFVSSNKFTFFDATGDVLGTIETDHGEGRTFRLALDGAPRQAALRFGAVQPILRGTGWFEGVEGLLADNSAVGIAPHAIATLYVLRIHDPKGKFRAGLRRPSC